MQIEISDDMAETIQAKALQAGFDSMEAYLRHLLSEPESWPDDPPAMPYEQWREKYWAFVARQKSRNPNFDDSRESWHCVECITQDL